MTAEYLPELIAVVLSLLYLAGIIAAIDALLTARTPQGAIAWSLFLVMFPVLGLPFYLIFGGRKFSGYINARRDENLPLQRKVQEVVAELPSTFRSEFEAEECDLEVFERLAQMPFLAHNQSRLLIDGEATFEAIFNGIRSAREYILVQFFIVKNDILGRQLQQALINKAKEGVTIYFLYDAVGCHALPSSYITALKNAGINTSPFSGSSHGGGHVFRLNFRNHRKIVIVDGHTAYVGGLNVGDEYMGKHPRLTPWRDTHMEIKGPAVLAVQLAFQEDWYWMKHEMLPVGIPQVCNEQLSERVLVIPTGPADELETCSLLFSEVIHRAKKRVWIVSPYFVPDDVVLAALQLAALRGVDVRIMLPDNPDHKLVYLASFAFLEETVPVGIKVYRYMEGFLHQKVFLVDDNLAGVGTANLDNRSFRLNFEITMLVYDKKFAADVETMLQKDFDCCRELSMAEINQRPWWFRLATRISRLFSPIL
jgi:cardiolipin synthase